MTIERKDFRIALPSKGRLAEDTLNFLTKAGLPIKKSHARQLQGKIGALPNLHVIFQRAGDIVVSVREGSVDFGITGWDAVAERSGHENLVMVLIPQLGYGHCKLKVIVPEGWDDVWSMTDLVTKRKGLGRRLRVATKYPNLTTAFFASHQIDDLRVIPSEGSLEIAPAIGYADLIVDLVTTGLTMSENRLRSLDDGILIDSQACLIANRQVLKSRQETRVMAKQLIEFLEAHLRAIDALSIFANMRGESPQVIAERMSTKQYIGGLQGPTISQIVHPEGNDWYAVHIIVRRNSLSQAIRELREIGGSGVVVTPVTYIFEEEPESYRAMLAGLED